MFISGKVYFFLYNLKIPKVTSKCTPIQRVFSINTGSFGFPHIECWITFQKEGSFAAELIVTDIYI